VKNLKVFVLCVLTCWLVVPIFYAFWKWLQLLCHRYELTTQRLRISQGVLNRRNDDLELYRVKDTRLEAPFVLRFFHLANIAVVTSDKLASTVCIPAVRNAKWIREQIRIYVEKARDDKRVREIDFR